MSHSDTAILAIFERFPMTNDEWVKERARGLYERIVLGNCSGMIVPWKRRVMPEDIRRALKEAIERGKAEQERERCDKELSAWRIAGAAISAHGVCTPEDLRKDFTPDRLREGIEKIGIRANAWEDSARVNNARANEAEVKLRRLENPDEALVEAVWMEIPFSDSCESYDEERESVVTAIRALARTLEGKENSDAKP